jgi:hypothetical protein
VQISPEDFSKHSIVAIEDNINAKYANKVSVCAACFGGRRSNSQLKLIFWYRWFKKSDYVYHYTTFYGRLRV